MPKFKLYPVLRSQREEYPVPNTPILTQTLLHDEFKDLTLAQPETPSHPRILVHIRDARREQADRIVRLDGPFDFSGELLSFLEAVG